MPSNYRDSLTPGQRAALDKLTKLRESGYAGWIDETGTPRTNREVQQAVQAASGTGRRNG